MGDNGENKGQARQQACADNQRAFGMSGQSVAKAVNHVEKRVILRDPKGKVGQLLDRIKRPRQKRQRRYDKIRYRCQMIEFFRPYAAQKPDQRH